MEALSTRHQTQQCSAPFLTSQPARQELFTSRYMTKKQTAQRPLPPNQITINIPIPDDIEQAQITDFLHEFCLICGRKCQRTRYEKHQTFNLVFVPIESSLSRTVPKNARLEQKQSGETT